MYDPSPVWFGNGRWELWLRGLALAFGLLGLKSLQNTYA